MTKHIEEARNLEPVAFITQGSLQELEEYSMASATVLSGKATHHFVRNALPLVRLSDAQAAISAAEERGRKAERAKIDEERGYIVDENGNKGWIIP